MRILLAAIFFLSIVGCASKKEVLSQESEKISNQIMALRAEEKAIVNLKGAISDYLKAKKEYELKREELEKIREEHEDRGLPIGPDVEEGIVLEEQEALLDKNQSTISDLVYELEQKKEKIFKEQEELE